jgi:hypothetical protein
VSEGQANASAVRRAVRRTLLQKLRTGLFDPLEGQVPFIILLLVYYCSYPNLLEAQYWTNTGAQQPTGGPTGEHTGGGSGGGGGDDGPAVTFGVSALNSSYSQRVSFEAALQGIVLLKNVPPAPPAAASTVASAGPSAGSSAGSSTAAPAPAVAAPALPFAAGGNVAVVGPFATEQVPTLCDYAAAAAAAATFALTAVAMEHEAGTQRDRSIESTRPADCRAAYLLHAILLVL